jgi:glycosyltransferase involved in cell wall biosynthesis
MLLMPSQEVQEGFEGFGLVHLEAAANGLPAIGSRDSGNEDAIIDRVTGFLVPQGDEDCLQAAIRTLLEQDGRWNAMSAAGLRFAGDMSWARTAELTLQGYLASKP